MALQTLAELREGIRLTANKRESVFTDAVVDNFIALAEAQMRREITSVGQVETYAEVEIDSTGWPLPCSAREIASVTYEGIELAYLAPDRKGEDESTGAPCHYTVDGKTLYVVPAGTVEIRVKQKLCALSAYVRCNWILRDHPDAYLYGALMQAAPFLRDDDRIAVWGNLFAQAIDSINRIERERQTGPFLKVQAGVTP